MRHKKFAALAALALIAGFGTPAAASAGTSAAAAAPAVSSTNPGSPEHHHPSGCARQMHAAVVEDNEAYNARDEQRYQAILNPDMIFAYDGNYTYGRDAIMADARAGFAIPGWVWTYEILSETMHGCDSGIAVLETHSINAAAGTDLHFAVTMTMVREHGKWTVAMDGVHKLSS
ncbi:nuclear transport factor 2 family protein [Nakamurella lactea]|uniref:nuclear transport factor 2 family protein n=1 Tax=Nakamurella lactea TaxID=459515 RepID=UPI00042A58E0|nr:nuclear transport factor 2 family protein [Nakamurella lactea]